jgi:F1F0 ATPase subunit 2
MTDIQIPAFSLAAGLVLGTFFFGGLWWTVNRVISSQRPGLWVFGSLLVRMSITLPGFYFVGREDWQCWLLCVLGFVLARPAVTWLTRPPVEKCKSRITETPHAP